MYTKSLELYNIIFNLLSITSTLNFIPDQKLVYITYYIILIFDSFINLIKFGKAQIVLEYILQIILVLQLCINTTFLTKVIILCIQQRRFSNFIDIEVCFWLNLNMYMLMVHNITCWEIIPNYIGTSKISSCYPHPAKEKCVQSLVPKCWDEH